MINVALINEISGALVEYRKAISRASEQQEIEDYSTLAAIVEKILAAIEAGDNEKIKLGVFGFSRQVSDSYSAQPVEYRALGDAILKLRKIII
jgi:hypothetical protein